MRVGEGEFETLLQVGMALDVPACELFGASGFYFVVDADYTRDASSMSA